MTSLALVTFIFYMYLVKNNKYFEIMVKLSQLFSSNGR